MRVVRLAAPSLPRHSLESRNPPSNARTGTLQLKHKKQKHSELVFPRLKEERLARSKTAFCEILNLRRPSAGNVKSAPA